MSTSYGAVVAADEMGQGVEDAINWSIVGVWAAAAAGGFLLTFLFVRFGGVRQPTSGLPRIGLPRIATHLVIAAVGLALWIFYTVSDAEWSAWAALGLLVIAIGLGGSMLLTKDRQRMAAVRAGGSLVSAAEGGAAGWIPAEWRYPMWLDAGHGGLAIATLVLVALNRAGVFGS